MKIWPMKNVVTKIQIELTKSQTATPSLHLQTSDFRSRARNGHRFGSVERSDFGHAVEFGENIAGRIVSERAVGG